MAMLREAQFKFIPFSKKQKQVLSWWIKGISPHSEKDILIADGAVRSGKTVIMSLSFMLWAMSEFRNKKFGMAGKTIGSFRRNVLFTLKIILRLRGFKVQDKRSENLLVVSKGDVINHFFIFGGDNEGSQDLVQGLTTAGFFFDEVALMPESFVNQAVARCSEEGRKIWFNCNPDGEYHWFKVNWIDQADIKNALHIHFLLTDNPSLSPKTIRFYETMFSGVFYKRFIIGLWVLAQGVIYDMFDDDNLYNDGEGPDYDLYYNRYYTTDYGTTNPFACLEIIEQGGIYYVENEFYYCSKKEGIQKDDSEYVKDVLNFIDGKRYTVDILDPSAASFKVALRKAGVKVKEADNDVLNGIRLTASLFTLKRLKVNRHKCPNVLKERASYIWKVIKGNSPTGKEEPMKENDHAMDALRYFCKTVVKKIRKMAA